MFALPWWSKCIGQWTFEVFVQRGTFFMKMCFVMWAYVRPLSWWENFERHVPKCKLLHWGFCFRIVTLEHVGESGVALILCKNKFEWIGFCANEETHVCPSELANDGINGNMWSLEKGERITLILPKFPHFPHWRKWKPLCSSWWGKCT